MTNNSVNTNRINNITSVKPFVHGHVGFASIENGTVPVRFTGGQLKFYSALSGTDYARCHSPVGIFLEFITGAPVISFDYDISDAYVIKSGIDIWEDGVLSANIPLEKSPVSGVHVEYRLKNSGGAQIKIKFPNGAVIIPYNFSLGDAKAVAAPEKTALFYGDSITQSAYIPTPSLSWTSLAADALGCREINRGIGSFIFDRNSLPDKTDMFPEYIFIEYGFNDLARFSDDGIIKDNAAAYLDRIGVLHPDARVYVITTDFGGGAAGNDAAFARREKYCGDIAELALKRGMKVLYGRRLVPSLPVMFVADGVHLSEAGSAVFAHNVIKYMKV